MAKNPWLSLWTRSLSRSPAKSTQALVRRQAKLARELFCPGASHAAVSGGIWLAGFAMALEGGRRFQLFKPTSMVIGERAPVVVMLHGCGQDAKEFAASAQMNAVAVRERFLVLYPEQDRLANAQRCWNWFELRNRRADGEMSLILQAIDQACLFHGGDPDRVAIVGLSAGASMAGLLASRHPERFRGVVMHSGVAPGLAHSNGSAWRAMRGQVPVRAVSTGDGAGAMPLPPLLVIQGGADRVVVPGNGRRLAEWWAGATEAREGVPRHVQRGNRYAMVVTSFASKRGEEVALVEIAELGHAWSGGARKRRFSDARGPSASRLAWRFLAKQFATPA